MKILKMNHTFYFFGNGKKFPIGEINEMQLGVYCIRKANDYIFTPISASMIIRSCDILLVTGWRYVLPEYVVEQIVNLSSSRVRVFNGLGDHVKLIDSGFFSH